MPNIVFPILFETDVCSNTISIQGEVVDYVGDISYAFFSDSDVGLWSSLFEFSDDGANVSMNVIQNNLKNAILDAIQNAFTGITNRSIVSVNSDELQTHINQYLKLVEIANTSFDTDYTDSALADTMTLQLKDASACLQSLYEQFRAQGRLVDVSTGYLDFSTGDTINFYIRMSFAPIPLSYSSTLLRGQNYDNTIFNIRSGGQAGSAYQNNPLGAMTELPGFSRIYRLNVNMTVRYLSQLTISDVSSSFNDITITNDTADSVNFTIQYKGSLSKEWTDVSGSYSLSGGATDSFDLSGISFSSVNEQTILFRTKNTSSQLNSNEYPVSNPNYLPFTINAVDISNDSINIRSYSQYPEYDIRVIWTVKNDITGLVGLPAPRTINPVSTNTYFGIDSSSITSLIYGNGYDKIVFYMTNFAGDILQSNQFEITNPAWNSAKSILLNNLSVSSNTVSFNMNNLANLNRNIRIRYKTTDTGSWITNPSVFSLGSYARDISGVFNANEQIEVIHIQALDASSGSILSDSISLMPWPVVIQSVNAESGVLTVKNMIADTTFSLRLRIGNTQGYSYLLDTLQPITPGENTITIDSWNPATMLGMGLGYEKGIEFTIFQYNSVQLSEVYTAQLKFMIVSSSTRVSDTSAASINVVNQINTNESFYVEYRYDGDWIKSQLYTFTDAYTNTTVEVPGVYTGDVLTQAFSIRLLNTSNRATSQIASFGNPDYKGNQINSFNFNTGTLTYKRTETGTMFFGIKWYDPDDETVPVGYYFNSDITLDASSSVLTATPTLWSKWSTFAAYPRTTSTRIAIAITNGTYLTTDSNILIVANPFLNQTPPTLDASSVVINSVDSSLGTINLTNRSGLHILEDTFFLQYSTDNANWAISSAFPVYAGQTLDSDVFSGLITTLDSTVENLYLRAIQGVAGVDTVISNVFSYANPNFIPAVGTYDISISSVNTATGEVKLSNNGTADALANFYIEWSSDGSVWARNDINTDLSAGEIDKIVTIFNLQSLDVSIEQWYLRVINLDGKVATAVTSDFNFINTNYDPTSGGGGGNTNGMITATITDVDQSMGTVYVTNNEQTINSGPTLYIEYSGDQSTWTRDQTAFGIDAASSGITVVSALTSALPLYSSIYVRVIQDVGVGTPTPVSNVFTISSNIAYTPSSILTINSADKNSDGDWVFDVSNNADYSIANMYFEYKSGDDTTWFSVNSMDPLSFEATQKKTVFFNTLTNVIQFNKESDPAMTTTVRFRDGSSTVFSNEYVV